MICLQNGSAVLNGFLTPSEAHPRFWKENYLELEYRHFGSGKLAIRPTIMRKKNALISGVFSDLRSPEITIIYYFEVL